MDIHLPDTPQLPPPTKLESWGLTVAQLLTVFMRDCVDSLRLLSDSRARYVTLDFVTKSTAAATYPLVINNPLPRGQEPEAVSTAQVLLPASPTAALQPIWDVAGDGRLRLHSLVYFVADTRYKVVLEVR